MVKLSISLPNNTQITLESEEAEVIQEVISLVLRDLPVDARLASVTAQDEPHVENGTGEKSTDEINGQGAPPSSSPSRRGNVPLPRQGANELPSQSAGTSMNGGSAPPASPGSEIGDHAFDLDSLPHQSREDFTAFCQSLNPMGDMRRVVVAAEAASRFFGLEGVTADELGELFDLAGWRRANSFTQTLRNAARSKFGWLERIPGRAGRYAATDLGRSTTLAV